MVSALYSGSSGLGLSAGWCHCVVFLARRQWLSHGYWQTQLDKPNKMLGRGGGGVTHTPSLLLGTLCYRNLFTFHFISHPSHPFPFLCKGLLRLCENKSVFQNVISLTCMYILIYSRILTSWVKRWCPVVWITLSRYGRLKLMPWRR